MFLYNFVKKNNITKKQFVVYFTMLITTIYLIFFAVFNQKGFISYLKLSHVIENKNSKKQQLENNIEVKQKMIESLSSDSLDLDLLDEEARKSLGYADKDETIIYLNNKK
jgi:cell division protein FtsB